MPLPSHYQRLPHQRFHTIQRRFRKRRTSPTDYVGVEQRHVGCHQHYLETMRILETHFCNQYQRRNPYRYPHDKRTPTLNLSAGDKRTPTLFSTSRKSAWRKSFWHHEQLVAKRAIERFDIAVLPRAALGDEQCFDISLFQPTADYLWTRTLGRCHCECVRACRGRRIGTAAHPSHLER